MSFYDLPYVGAAGWDQPPAGRCLPRTDLLYDYIERRWPISDQLGCYNNRAMTSGSSPSVHRDGRAFDTGFLQDDSDVVRLVVANWLTDNADKLGVQMVLVYDRAGSGGWFWRLARYSDENGPQLGDWNRRGHWLHVEIHPSVAMDETPIEDLLGETVPTPDPKPKPNTREIQVGPVTMQEVRRGQSGGFVAKAQAIISANFGHTLAADGIFGPRTDTAVRDVQARNNLYVDGIVGPRTWTTLLETESG